MIGVLVYIIIHFCKFIQLHHSEYIHAFHLLIHIAYVILNGHLIVLHDYPEFRC